MNKNLNLNLPRKYKQFLSEINYSTAFVIDGTGIILYSEADLMERNNTYEIEQYEPDFFLIGQDGDLAFFIKKDTDDTIYANDLGALGSLKMEIVSPNINEFISYAKNHYDEL